MVVVVIAEMMMMMMMCYQGEQLHLFLQLQVLPVVSELRAHLLHLCCSDITSVLRQFLDREYCTAVFHVVV